MAFLCTTCAGCVGGRTCALVCYEDGNVSEDDSREEFKSFESLQVKEAGGSLPDVVTEKQPPGGTSLCPAETGAFVPFCNPALLNK